MTRRERIVFLLDNLGVCLGPGVSSQSTGQADKLGVPLTSSMASDPVVVELVRCVELLHRIAPEHGLHLEAYFGCDRAVERKAKTVMRGGKTRRVVGRDGRPVEILSLRRPIPAWLARVPLDGETGEPRTVARGIDFISAAFRGDPSVPRQLLVAA